MEPESEAGQTTFVSYDHVVELPAARGAQMSDYRVYFIGDDGHFVSAIQLDCPNDIAAIESAKQFINGHDIELWQQDRIIAKFERKPGGQWREVSTKSDALDWDNKATEALERARLMPAGQEKKRSPEKGWHVAQCRRHPRTVLCEALRAAEVRPPQFGDFFPERWSPGAVP